MYLGYAIIGLLAGLFIAGSGIHWLLAGIGGVAIGILLARLIKLERQVQRLEASTRRAQLEDASPWNQPAASDTPEAPLETAASPWDWAEPETPPEEGGHFDLDKPLHQPMLEQDFERSLPGSSILQTILEKAKTWITTGNVPAKVGVIISFFGVGFLLKYAIDRKLLVFPLELRLLGVAAAGVVLLVIGWRLRLKERVYALSLQGGGVGILFLTIFAALQVWHLLPATLAFLLLVLLTIITGSLAVLQNSRMLAILGVIGGFLAPILASTGQGDHVVLFGYYLVLNIAILGIAWFRAWRGLNLIGWVFTFVVGSVWGYQYYKPELFGSTQPFLLLHFLLYQAVAILFALRQPPKRIGIVDGTLVFGTPIIAFALQAALVEGLEDALAISAVVVAAFYALTATWLWRSKGEPLRLLTESFIALAVVFGTIAVPLAFDARWTSAAWAIEGAALVWVGTRQHRQLSKLAGTLLIFLSGIAFLEHGWQQNTGLPVLNGNVLGGVLISFGALFASRKLETIDDPVFKQVQQMTSMLLFTWGVVWWIGTGGMEITDRMEFTSESGQHNRVHAFLLFLTVSTATAAWLGRVRQWPKARSVTLIFLPLLILVAAAYLLDDEHFLLSAGWLAWPLAWAVQAFVLKLLDEFDQGPVAAWHFLSLLFFTVMLAIEASWWVNLVASSAWASAVASAVPGCMALLVWRLHGQSTWPVSAQPQTYISASILMVASQVAGLVMISLNLPGDPSPWPYIPVLNPFDLAMLFAMLTAAKSLQLLRQKADHPNPARLMQVIPAYKLMLAGAFFLLTTIALVRGVHHYTGIRWDAEALFDSVIVQTALSIYWGLLGFTGMIWGARSKRRPLWLAGAGFMTLVVLKLFAIDLGNTGTVERIISFIGIGALLLVVGYLAPAPPRAGRESNPENEQDPERSKR